MNDYKRIQSDFSFLSLYGYKFAYIGKSYIYPQVVFSNGSTKIIIGMNYVDGKIFIEYYYDTKSSRSKGLLDDVEFNSRKYENQLEKAKEILKKFLIKLELKDT